VRDTVAEVVVVMETVPDQDTESDAVGVLGFDGDGGDVRDSVYVVEPELDEDEEAQLEEETVYVPDTDGDVDGEGDVESVKLIDARPEVDVDGLGEPMRDSVGDPLGDLEDVPHAVYDGLFEFILRVGLTVYVTLDVPDTEPH
jgi:hypothetical protein